LLNVVAVSFSNLNGNLLRNHNFRGRCLTGSLNVATERAENARAPTIQA